MSDNDRDDIIVLGASQLPHRGPLTETVTEKAFGIVPDIAIDLTKIASANSREVTTHQHVVVKWDGGELWLDMSTLGDHHCVDVRQFNSAGHEKAQGYFTIVNGRRVGQIEAPIDKNGTAVAAHGFPGGYLATLLTDLDGKEAATFDPTQRWGY